MVEYIDLVLVSYEEGKIPSLCQAPAFSHLKVGDRVIYQCNDEEMDDEYDEMDGIVEALYTINKTDTEEFDFIIKAHGSFPLHKILRKVNYTTFEYKEDDDHE